MCLRESRSTSTEFASDVLGLFAASKLGGVGGFWEFSVNVCLV